VELEVGLTFGRHDDDVSSSTEGIILIGMQNEG
jgi:hypothetical protein